MIKGMNKLRALVIIQLKESFSKSRGGLNIKGRLGKLLQLAVIALLAIPAVTLSTTISRAFVLLGRPELLVTSMYVNSVMLIFFLGIPFLVSVFFYSRDLRFLAALPVKEETIVFAKLSTVYLYLLAVNTLFLGPALVLYGINVGISFTLIVTGIVALLIGPVLPLLVSALLVLLFSRFISQSRHKNLLSILGSLFLIIVILVIQMGITRFAENPEQLGQLYLNPDRLLGFIGMRFPPSIWLTGMITGSLFDGLLFVGISILFVLIIQSVARLYFRRSLMAFSQGTAAGGGRIYYRQRSRGVQLLRRHILIIVKEPTFLLNTLLSMIVPLFMFAVMAFSGENVLEMLNSPQIEPYLTLIFTGILIAPAIISNISATAITREGKAFWETRALPISSRGNIRYRVLTTIILNLTGLSLLFLISIFMLPLKIGMYLPALLAAVSGTLFLATVDFIINIYKPQLNWTHPTAAVKNNMSVTISLGVRALIGLIVYGIYRIFPGLFADLDLVVYLAAAFFLIGYLITRQLLYSKFVTRFERITI